MKCGGFAKLRRFVCLRHKRSVTSKRPIDGYCRAVESAKSYYFYRVKCLQFAAALVCLLRRSGFPAEVVIGVVQRPFTAHAWVELDGCLIAGGRHDQEHFRVIDRF